MASIFTRIIRGEIPCYKIAEDDRYFAFLDINPLAEGHTLVIPRTEVDYLFDLDEDNLSGLFVFARRVARAIDAAVECERVGVAVLGLEVPHAHVHLCPINGIHDLDFSQPKLQFSESEFAATAARIRSFY